MAFEFYDLDGDGLISHEDCLEVQKSVQLLVGDICKFEEALSSPLIDIFDTTDGPVDFPIFKDLAKNNPKILQSLLLFDGVV